MKRSVIFILLLAMINMSCSKDVLDFSSSTITTQLLLGGDYVEMSVSPLTKSINQTYYAFEIDSVHVSSYRIDYRTEEYIYDTTYVHYAGGIFTDVNNLGVILDKGHKYRIRCSVIEESKDKLYVENGYIFEPFVDSGQAQINNSFIYGGTKDVFAYNTYSYMRTYADEKNFAAQVNRYYGELITDIVEDDASIMLEMERRNFGIHFIINPPKEGVLKVWQNYGSPKFEYILNKESSTINEECIYALGLINDHTTLDIKVMWTRADGEVVDLSPGMTKFYNKTMTTIKVDVNDRVGNSDIDINLDSDMTHDEIVIK